MVGHCAKVEVVELKGEGKLPAHLMRWRDDSVSTTFVIIPIRPTCMYMYNTVHVHVSVKPYAAIYPHVNRHM